jgi:hypothetical protein
MTTIPEIPFEYLDPSRIDDSRSRAAAIIVLLTQQTSYSRVGALGALAATITGEEGDRFLSDAIEAIKSRQVEIGFASGFLLDFIAHSEPAGHRAIEVALRGLDGLVRRRTSHLDDPLVWGELKLPSV